MRGFPSVTLYIRRNGDHRQHYERVKRVNPQVAKATEVYCLHFYENGKRKWLTVGKDLRAAYADRGKKELELASGAVQTPTTPKPSPDVPKDLEQQREAFLEDRRTTTNKDGSFLAPDTIRQHELETRRVIDTVQRKFATEITRQDLKTWMMVLRQGDEKHPALCHRTVCNRYMNIVTFLKFCKIDHKELLPQSERPAVVEEDPEAYTQKEMARFFFITTDERDALFFEFLLKTGAREREATNLEWTDLNLGPNPTVKIQTKEGFRTKTGKSRTVPLERSLTNKLLARHEKNPASRYVFPRADGEVERKFLDRCKRYARLAGLNCNSCQACIKHEECENYFLHKFRDTFGTWAVQRGVPIPTVQKWMGHASIEMTMRYLAPQKGEVAQNEINRAFGVETEYRNL
jgi:integrase/recombinase XerD